MNNQLKLLFAFFSIFISSLFFLTTAKAETIPTVTEFSPSDTTHDFRGITSGPDGNLWFTALLNDGTTRIGKITKDGNITEYSFNTEQTLVPHDVTSGSDGNLWFTGFINLEGFKIGRITPSGSTTGLFSLSSNSGAERITNGPDGNLWFTQPNWAKIGKITTSGDITEFPLTSVEYVPLSITKGADSNVWFTEANSTTGKCTIGKITTGGAITEYPLAESDTSCISITDGPDGNVWFTLGSSKKIGRITPTGTITLYSIASGNIPKRITNGPDGNLWFTEANSDFIGRITPNGVITEFPITITGGQPDFITKGTDGNLWFTEVISNTKIGKVNLSTTTPTPSTTPSPSPTPTPKQGTVYVALGDSFSSGEGAPNFNYLQGTDVENNRCHRSSGAWPYVLNNIIQDSPWDTGLDFFTFRACSGAVTQDFTNKNKDKEGEPKQLSWLNEHTGLVTFTIGGNNVGFGDVMKYCALRLPNQPLCETVYGGLVDAKLTILKSKFHNDDRTLAHIYDKVGKAAPHAKIVVVGYPRFFPTNPPKDCSTAGAPQYKFVKSDMKWMNKQVNKMNSIIKQAVDNQNKKEKNNRFVYVDVFDAFNGHEICTQTPYMNRGIIWWRPTVWTWSYHPNLAGNQKIAEIVATQLGITLPQF